MRILVTGACGFIGSHLCEGLINAGHAVSGLSRRSGGGVPGVDIIQADMGSAEDVARALKADRFDAVFHMASQQPGGGAPDSFFRTNVVGARNLLNAMRETDIKTLIISSSSAVYGKPEYNSVDERHPAEPLTFYGLSKLEADSYARLFAGESKCRVVVLRYTGVYGQKVEKTFIKYLFESFAGGVAPEVLSGHVKADYVFVEDVVQANLKALDNVPDSFFEVFNIGGGFDRTRMGVAEAAGRVCGSLRPVKDGGKGGVNDFDFVFDISKAERKLGYKPGDLEENMCKYWKWYMENNKR